MPNMRNQGTATLLPNGQVLITSGSKVRRALLKHRSKAPCVIGPFVKCWMLGCALQYGKAGGGLVGYGGARDGTLNAVLYDPFAPEGQRFTCLGASTIERYYHNAALLLPSGDVLVGGGEQGPPATFWCDPPGQYLPEFRAERFKLPYAYALFRPTITDVRAATVDEAAPAVVSVPVFGYGVDIAITFSYAGERCTRRRLTSLAGCASLRVSVCAQVASGVLALSSLQAFRRLPSAFAARPDPWAWRRRRRTVSPWWPRERPRTRWT